ncbi:MAG: di-heme oxidoredictase family protein [Burkholderiales bacterium]
MIRATIVLLGVVLVLLPSGAWLAPASGLPPQALSGGTLSVADDSPAAYSHPIPTLDAKQRELFALGNQMFTNRWAFFWFENAMFGRGPTSNAQACTTCHAANGRGLAPGLTAPVHADAGEERDHHIAVPLEPAPNLVIRISIPGTNAHGGPNPHPYYGDQLQTFGVKGVVKTEGQFTVEWREVPGTFADGEQFALRKPLFKLTELAYGPLGAGAMFGARLPPPMIGMGLLEAIPEATLLALEANPPVAGIRGRANRVWDASQGRVVVGRFGSKANHGSLREQIASAFINDIGLSSPVYPEQNCPDIQMYCKEQMVAGQPEITTLRLAATELYLRALSVPARRNLDDPAVARGEQLFGQAQCAACHVPEFRTGEYPPLPALANQLIRPYTDLLLHDMGEALADGRPDYAASGSQWRTPPLWGIGLSEKVNGASAFLHDGRARDFTEAVLWHGGEAEVSREAFRKLAKEDRKALVEFLRSL